MDMTGARVGMVRSVKAWLHLAQVAASIAEAAPVVIGRRLLVLSTASPRRARREAGRMVGEKVEATGQILLIAATTVMQSPAQSACAVLVPVHRRVLANRRRLSRR